MVLVGFVWSTLCSKSRQLQTIAVIKLSAWGQKNQFWQVTEAMNIISATVHKQQRYFNSHVVLDALIRHKNKTSVVKKLKTAN